MGGNLLDLNEILKNLIVKIDEIRNSSHDLDVLTGKVSTLASELDLSYPKIVLSIGYDIKNNLSHEEFLEILLEIEEILPSIYETINLDIYFKSRSANRSNISKDIINLRNSLVKRHDTKTIQDLLESLKSHTELAELKAQIAEIKDTYSIINQVKENKTLEGTFVLNTGYADEVKILDKKIEQLNKYIFSLFTSIIIAITVKTCFVLSKFENLNDLYSLLVFLSLIISFSALITYLIKERNRLIKIHDNFKINVLELSTLPDYMNELNAEQRKQMYVDLSTNYFRGGNHTNDVSNSRQNDIDGIKSTVTDLTKIITDLNDTVKKLSK